MRKPIEPQCIAVVVPHPYGFAVNVGRMVRVLHRYYGAFPPHIKEGPAWVVIGLACALHTRGGLSSGEAIAHEATLRRIDDDTDVAAVPVVEQELEHA